MGYLSKYTRTDEPPACFVLVQAGHLITYNCEGFTSFSKTFLCEKDGTQSGTADSQRGSSWTQQGIHLPIPTDLPGPVSAFVCPAGHWTHQFLACDRHSACGHLDRFRQHNGSDASGVTSLCLSTLAMLFSCRNGVGRVPYSLVCDHSQDCLDNSDEDFCVHPSCSGSWQFECMNRQVS